MGRTACTEPQCLYKGALYRFTLRLSYSWYPSVKILAPQRSESRSQWPRGQRLRSAAARLLRFGFESRWWHGCLSVVTVVCVVR
jgi:hypothetical protein